MNILIVHLVATSLALTSPQNPSALAKLDKQLASGNVQASSEGARKLVLKFPKNYRLRIIYAKSLLQQDQINAASSQVQKAKTLPGSKPAEIAKLEAGIEKRRNIKSMLAQANAMVGSNRPAEAWTLTRQAYEADRTSFPTFVLAVKAGIGAADFDGARALLNMGSQIFASSSQQEAIERLRQTVETTAMDSMQRAQQAKMQAAQRAREEEMAKAEQERKAAEDARLQAEKEARAQAAAEARAKIDDCRARLDSAQQDIDTKEAEIDALDKEISAAEDEDLKLEGEMEEVESSLEKATERLRELQQTQAENKSNGQAGAIANLVLIGPLNDAERKVKDLKARQSRLKSRKSELGRDMRRMNKDKERAADAVSKLKEKVAEIKSELEGYKAAISNNPPT